MALRRGGPWTIYNNCARLHVKYFYHHFAGDNNIGTVAATVPCPTLKNVYVYYYSMHIFQ